LFIVQGRIDKFKVQQSLKDNSARQEAYLGQALYRSGTDAVVVLDKVLLVGQLNAVKKAVDTLQIPGSRPLRADLMAAIQAIPAGNQIWAVGDLPVDDLDALGVRGPAPATEMLKTLQSGTYQMRVDTGVHALATGNFADIDSAKKVGDLARGILALARTQVAKQQPDMTRLLDGIQVSNNGRILTLRIEESGDLLKRLGDLRMIGKTLQ